MTIKVGIINIALFLGVLLMVTKTLDVWQSGSPASQSKQKENVGGPPPSIDTPHHTPPETLYENIVRDNLFSKDREEYVPTVEPKAAPIQTIEPQSRINGKTIVLYGVILMDDYASALVNNIDPKPGEKLTVWLRKGESIGNLKLKDIKKDHIILSEGPKRYKILLHDETKTRAGVAAPPPKGRSPEGGYDIEPAGQATKYRKAGAEAIR